MEEEGSLAVKCIIFICCCFTIQVLESVVKNCGQTVHDEVASKQTMEELKDLLKVTLFLFVFPFPSVQLPVNLVY